MKDLIDCYLSEQISEPDWQNLLKETPGLKDAWENHFNPLGDIAGLKIVIRSQLANMEDEIKHLSSCLETMRRVLNGY